MYKLIAATVLTLLVKALTPAATADMEYVLAETSEQTARPGRTLKRTSTAGTRHCSRAVSLHRSST